MRQIAIRGSPAAEDETLSTASVLEMTDLVAAGTVIVESRLDAAILSESHVCTLQTLKPLWIRTSMTAGKQKSAVRA